MLARREYFRVELERKLRNAKGVDQAELNALLDEFEQRDWLSEARATQSLVQAKQRRFGSTRIAAELAQRGAGDEAVARASAALKASELERAKVVWRKRFRTLPTSLEERAKHTRFLMGRGFSATVIARVLQSDDE